MSDTSADLETLHDLLRRWDDTETWRRVVGDSRYLVSSHGRVMGPSLRVLAPSKTRGYLHVSLSYGQFSTTVRVHRLVAAAFLGPAPFDGAEIAHNDGNPENCRVINLRWATPVENAADIDRHGRRIRGEFVHGAKLSEEHIPEIRRRAASGERYEDIAYDFGVSISTVSLIKLRKVWAHV